MRVDPKKLVTPTEAARIRGVSIQAISQLIKRGSLKTVDIGGRLFLDRDEVESFTPSKGGRPKKEERRNAPKKSSKVKPKGKS